VPCDFSSVDPLTLSRQISASCGAIVRVIAADFCQGDDRSSHAVRGIETHMKSIWAVVASGVMVGATCTVLLWIPPIRNLEQDVGLPWLFNLRAPIKPSDRLVMVATNHLKGPAFLDHHD
jgi:hypothetical protein